MNFCRRHPRAPRRLRRRWPVYALAAVLVIAVDTALDFVIDSSWVRFADGFVVSFVAIQATGRYLRSGRRRRPETSLADLEKLVHALTGWKRAALSFGYPGVRFRGAGIDTEYDAVAVAVCGLNRPHAAPQRDCACGFHAVKDRNNLYGLAKRYEATVCDLEVELSGHFVQYKRGWRAARQQVVSVRIDSRCWGCGAPPEGLALVSLTAGFKPVCAQCLRPYSRLYTLAELAAELGVHDVRWADRPALQKGN